MVDAKRHIPALNARNSNLGDGEVATTAMADRMLRENPWGYIPPWIERELPETGERDSKKPIKKETKIMPRYSNQTLAKNALRDIRNSIEWLNDSLECIEERNIIELSPDDYTDLMEGGLRVLNNLSDFPKATGDDGCFQERWIEVKEKTAKPSNGHR